MGVDLHARIRNGREGKMHLEQPNPSMFTQYKHRAVWICLQARAGGACQSSSSSALTHVSDGTCDGPPNGAAAMERESSERPGT